MFIGERSEKLENYLRKIESETGRQIMVKEIPRSELYKMKSAFVHHPEHILILLASGSNLSEPEIEQSIAHEATHGLLVYSKKYCIGIFKQTPTEKEKKLITLVFTMVSDIVVNNILQQEGFLPYSPKYRQNVQDETVAIQKGIKLYNNISKDISYMDKHMVFRYILAWGYLKFIDLDDDMYDTLIEFMNEFKLKYTEQFTTAMKIQGIILLADIFTATGYNRVIEQLLQLWELDHLVELRTI